MTASAPEGQVDYGAGHRPGAGTHAIIALKSRVYRAGLGAPDDATGRSLMNVFDLRRPVADYQSYTHSLIKIRDPRIDWPPGAPRPEPWPPHIHPPRECA
jgi:hypothetical protein